MQRLLNMPSMNTCNFNDLCCIYTSIYFPPTYVCVCSIKVCAWRRPDWFEDSEMGCCFGKALVAIEGLLRDLLEAVVIVLVKHVAGRFVCSKLGLHRWYVLRVG